eukprot:6940393-Alexandrium_andersonii.AAC.1
MTRALAQPPAPPRTHNYIFQTQAVGCGAEDQSSAGVCMYVPHGMVRPPLFVMQRRDDVPQRSVLWAATW